MHREESNGIFSTNAAAETFIEKYKDDGIIWYFDNCELNLDATIRVLWKLNELGYFKYTKAIIFGRFGCEESYYGYNNKTCFHLLLLHLFLLLY